MHIDDKINFKKVSKVSKFLWKIKKNIRNGRTFGIKCIVLTKFSELKNILQELFTFNRRCHDGYYVCQVYNRTTIDHNKQHKCLDGLLLQTEKIHLEVVGDDPEIVIKPTGYIPDIGAGSEDRKLYFYFFQNMWKQ